ncbi:type IV toxin-antitoxin system AbiEi family antitoxin domain-containing protein [Arabiibacter massiliensis]|uniref:type IV toxin-antitoxin system AbiEi family antitoxin domain-containing protein n=1 Tax=Arabiibacter massiliensis TaxID=1870985 RepID=UPI0009BA2FAC|nr:hypothetical protein [Arabiibacter massiliensis]
MKTNDGEMALLFSQAESRGTCVVPSDTRIRESMRRQVERGKAVRPVRGAYARASYWNALPRRERALHKMRSLQELHPDWVFCHESAALAYGLPVTLDRLDNVHVITSQRNRNATCGAIRWHIVENDRAIEAGGLRVTSLTRTVFDCMRTSDFKQALATADGALRLTGMGSSTFASRFMQIGSGLAGFRHAIKTMHCADARSESAGESIARAAMIELGFALPELQVPFRQPMSPGRTFRVDFLWTRLDGSMVIGEFDGMQKYEDAAMRGGRAPLRVLADEQHRESQLTLYGMPIVRFSYKDVMDAKRFETLLDNYGIPRRKRGPKPDLRS